jgi:hypothetical protein
MRRQRNRHHVIRRLGRTPIMLWMKLDPHRGGIDDHTHPATRNGICIVFTVRV